jgi:acyl transferase domain-containing protein/NAD(P)H-dependent flavin oxidoreductase YrpB (nitropropane dioxygenase family)/NAD(P)-dependent dehydrogenase (short-subunit alcohol dehydrogenase family)
MQEFKIIALTLPGMPDPSIAIAASRAGDIGLLDLEYVRSEAIALSSFHRLAKFATHDFGIKLNVADIGFIAKIAPELPQHFKFVILTGGSAKQLKDAVNDLHHRNLTVFVVCTALAQAQKAENIGADGVIAKGCEAGGRVGNETTFILVQQFLDRLSLPVWAQGGIGLHTAAACHAAGAAGIVIDAQLALTRESVLSEDIKSKIARMDGTETLLLGKEIGEPYRICSRLSLPIINTLKQKALSLLKARKSKASTITYWNKTISRYVSSDFAEHQLFLFGQDIAFAAPLADRFVTVGGIIQAIRQSAESHSKAVQLHQSLAEGSALAQSHGTRYPIVQGPMARVSDNAAFVSAVAQHGALPFVAAAWMRQHDLDTLLKETRAQLDEKPWGVGLLGFLPPEVYQEQIKTILNYRPPYALIAGGQPNQAKVLEQEGIATYLHVPSQGLLRMFLESGVQRFVFEGRESGGHIGPLCSFVLWEMMIEVLLEYLDSGKRPDQYHVLFAGGIHDATSAAMVAVMAAALVERGVRVGIQLGSAYLFTEEAVASGAIVKNYAEEAIRCNLTTVLESGPGHAVRCINNAFAKAFELEKTRLINKDSSSDEIHAALQRLQLGRMRIASKGVAKISAKDQDPSAPKLLPLGEDEQSSQGMYLIGQLAALKSRILKIAELHHDIVDEGSKRIGNLHEELGTVAPIYEKVTKPSDIAIVGMACFLPKALTVQQYWENILNKVNAVREIPEDRWDWRLYYDSNRNATDKIYSKWGAFLDDISFDPAHYGLPPNSLSAIEPLQLLTLEVVRRAFDDAGYSQRPFSRERTSVILGISGSGELGQQYNFRTSLPTFFGNSSKDIVSHFEQVLPSWTEDSFPGILLNVAAGRVANRFDLGGLNCTVDGACASSLAAIYMASRELETRTSDVVVVGGVDCMQNPFTYMCFSKTQALSPRGRCNALDENADGIVLGEGISVMILKRLAEAERDGDRIYGIIKGIGASSDGRDKSLTAPGRKGQIRALKRAYGKANVSPATVELIEAHATGTTVGDRVEIESLSQVFKDSGAVQHMCAIGSIKSMIGHTKSAAGLASLMKATLALYHKVLPPTIGVEKPNSVLLLPDTPFYVNTETRPWIHHNTDYPRRAGVSAFGFGGTNFHVVLEEYRNDYLEHLKRVSFQEWPGELFIWAGRSRNELMESLEPLEEVLARETKPLLAILAYAYARMYEQKLMETNGSQVGLAVVANSLDDLAHKLKQAKEALASSKSEISDPRGVYFAEKPLISDGKIAFLFPGQGSQYIDMLADLAIQFPEIRACFERSDQILEDRFPRPLSHLIFPKPAFSEVERRSRERALAQTQIAQPAMGTVNLALFNLIKSFAVEPDMVAGHSYGEYVALCAAGVLQEKDLIALSEARARFIIEGAGPDSGAMAAVNAGSDQIEKIIDGIESLWIANVNAPNQTVITGSRSAIEKAIDRLDARGLQARRIPVSCAFHSPIVEPACAKLKDFLSDIKLDVPNIKVYSNTTARIYPDDPQAIADQLVQHLISRVEFVREIEAMYENGARIFVEIGPGRVLSNLVNQILGDRPHLAVISNQAKRSGLIQLQHLLGRLAVHGVGIKLDRLYRGRFPKDADLKSLLSVHNDEKPSPTTWMINGARAKPYGHGTGSGPEKANIHLQTTANKMTIDQPLGINSGEQTSADETVQRIRADTHDTPTQPDDFNATSYKGIPHSGDGANRVMAQYQQLMQRFLETQKSVMLSYLQGTTDHSEDATFEAKQTLRNLQTPSLIPTDQIRIQESISEQAKIESPLDSEPPAPDAIASSSGGETSLNLESLTSQLLEIVSERTGYPQEMLELDVDLEAELGIDSIKRVEILGNYLQFVFGTDQIELPAEMENLNQIKTLRQIIDQVEAYRESSRTGQPENISAHAEDHTTASPADFDEPRVLPRFTLSPMEVPPPNRTLQLARERFILMTDDGAGIAESLKQKLMHQGHHVALIHFGETIEGKQNHYYNLKENFAETVSELIRTLRERHGPVGGVVHLLPLRRWPSFEEAEMSDWHDRLRLDLKTLFYLLKLSENDLKQAAKDGGGIVVAATGMGGGFGSDPLLSDKEFFPGNGAIPGLLKTVAVEWPEIRVKSVDLNLKESKSILADHLLSEIQADDDLVEVGYEGARRLTLGLTDAPLSDSVGDVLQIDSSWVILITGGARGITFQVALELARQHQATLILAGRSQMPPEEESKETADVVDEKELKSVLIANMKSQGESVSLAEVEATYQKLCKEREIRANLAAMRQQGARVSYVQVDVRDEQQFGHLIDEIYQSYGRLDGVIHGAGIIEDKLFTDKAWDSFARVFHTKSDSVFILSRKLRFESLKFLALFSSVAGCFASQGQCDYTAANEVVNKLAVYLNGRWPARVVSINWGPWEGSGMVSAEVQRQFVERGVGLIPPAAGADTFELELRKGQKEEIEVVIGDGPWCEYASPKKPSVESDRFLPLLHNPLDVSKNNGVLEIVRCLDPANDLYLQDHCIDFKPVLPAAMAIELMAECAQMGWPDWKVAAINDIRVLKGIVLNAKTLDIRVSVRPHENMNPQSDTMKLEATLKDSQRPETTHYKATVILKDILPAPQQCELPTQADMSSFWASEKEAYEKWLFHGSIFQCIRKIEGISDKGIVATLVHSSPSDCLANEPKGHWLVDPIVLDGGLQLGLLWTRNYFDLTLLPSTFKAVHLFKPFDSLSSTRCYIQFLEKFGQQSFCFNVFFLDQEGYLRVMIEGLEGTGSKALNRLAGSHLL